MTILEPVLIDILAVESATLDLHAKPYMLLYAAEVASLDNFTPNNETSQRLLMTSKMFIDSYFGNKTYAQAMINASAHALLPGTTQQGTDERNAVGLPEGKASVSRKTKSTKKKLMILAIAILVLLLNFPLLHMLYVNVKLKAIPLPLSDQVVSMGSNGLGPSGSNISFTLNKRYPSPLAAKEDISRQLTAVGIAAPKATERPTYTFAHDGENSRSDDRIDNIEFIYDMSDGNDYTFTIFFEQPVLCSYDDTTAQNLCEGEKKDKSLTAKLANSRPVSSTRVTASVKF